MSTVTTTASQLDSVLVLYYENEALVTRVTGRVTQLDWSIEGEVDGRSLCSLTFRNELFIYGQVLRNELLIERTENLKTRSKLELPEVPNKYSDKLWPKTHRYLAVFTV